MKYIINKMFWDYEKEEAWLNEMAMNGYAMVKYSYCKYTFVECIPNQYTYRIELLDRSPKHRDCVRYLQAMQDKGVEVMSVFSRRVFFRKNNNNEAFEVNIDNKSKVKHYEKVFILFYMLMISNMAIGLGNIIISKGSPSLFFSIFIGIVSALLGCVIGYTMVLPVYRKLKKLRQETEMTE